MVGFLDPEPRRVQQQHPPRKQRNSSGGGFFSSKNRVDDPRYLSGNKYARRRPLEERSPSQNNRQKPEHVPGSPTKSTVRIVKQSPTGSAHDDPSDFEKPARDKNTDERATDEHVLAGLPRLPENAVVKPAKVRDAGFPPGSAAAAQDTSVSELPTSPNEARSSGIEPSDALLVSGIHDSGTGSAWHRRSGSWGNFSTSSTLKEGDRSSLSFVGGSRLGGTSRSRLSQVTTLRGTPTPYEQEHRERIEAEEGARRGSAHALETLDETSPERSTVRVVPTSLESESSPPQLQHDEATQSSPIVRRVRSPSTEYELHRVSSATGRTSSTTSSLPTAANLPEDTTVIQYSPEQRQASLSPSESSLPAASSPIFAIFPSEESIPRSSIPPSSPNFTVFHSEQTASSSSIPPSSPNFITFHSDASRPRSRSHPLHGAVSQDSIASRLQRDSLRPETGYTAASLGPSSSTDTLPPLQVPKKRLRHKPASLSLSAAADASAVQGSKMVTEEEIDTLPYPRYQFSSHLSTIASESDRQSGRSSQPLSHFSLGSGILTGDDSSSIPLSSSNWSVRRRGSAPIESLVASSPAQRMSTGDEPGDMTLGIFREESAKPQPLFKSAPGLEDKRYDGPLPPIPPIPQASESDENFDTVSELQSPPLREQRSGYSLRTRSNSTPSRSQSQSRKSNSHSRHLSQASYIESDRGSHGSSIFPIWAKQFYKHNVPLLSASKVSLTGAGPAGNAAAYPPQQQQQRPSHLRNDSSWTERSITSRLGTGYSEIDPTAATTSSPTSSHFLPSIFRPSSRGRSKSNKHAKIQKTRTPRPSQDDVPRPDSMVITPADQQEVTAAGQPKYGALKDASSPSPAEGSRRPLPRKYSKQAQWNEMTFPRPMTKDRLSDFHLSAGGDGGLRHPSLGPSKRFTGSRLSIWRAPSFVESLPSLVRSKTNRQILLFALGFVCPVLWMLGAVLPISARPVSSEELEKRMAELGKGEGGDSGVDVGVGDVERAMMAHEAGDAERRWREERMWLKGRWWRGLNRIMSVVGVLVVGAVIALAVVATG